MTELKLMQADENYVSQWKPLSQTADATAQQQEAITDACIARQTQDVVSAYLLLGTTSCGQAALGRLFCACAQASRAERPHPPHPSPLPAGREGRESPSVVKGAGLAPNPTPLSEASKSARQPVKGRCAARPHPFGARPGHGQLCAPHAASGRSLDRLVCRNTIKYLRKYVNT
ncbi:helicase, Snf2 family [Candidatus Burkholderia brachyanthoides]|nr:helicase, Snf2 family [Candidatus Burkholderia brachyanthoides]